MNDETQNIRVLLPSGRTASVRHFNAAAANAMADEDLAEQKLAWHKALSFLIADIEDEAWPRWGSHKREAIAAADKLPLSDLFHIVFMSIAHYYEGEFVGDLMGPDKKTYRTIIRLLEDDGEPVEQFRPNPYPLGTEHRCEWVEDVKGVGQVEFMFNILNGAVLRQDGLQDGLGQYIARKPRYKDPRDGQLKLVDVKSPATPGWVTRCVGRKIKEMDPVIQYTITFGKGGRKQVSSLFAQPDFFLQDFQ